MTDDLIQRATVYKGEVQFMSWAESEVGRRATFRLDPDVGTTHPFKGMKHGTRLMVVAVAIADDETPQPQKPQAEHAQRPSKLPFKDCDEGEQARRLCGVKAFQDWLGMSSYQAVSDHLKQRYGVVSKSDIAKDPEIAEEWRSLRDTFIVETKWGPQ